MNRKLTAIIILGITLPILAGCAGVGNEGERQTFNDATLVAHYFPTTPQGTMSFTAGTYEGGTAIIGPLELAFWVKEGVAYTVNEPAAKVAPDLEHAPDHIMFSDAFIEAANSLPE